MHKFVLTFFVVSTILFPVHFLAAASTTDAAVWEPSGTLYLDGYVHAMMHPKRGNLAARFPHAREIVRQGFLMEAYQKLGMIPREEWLGDAFPESSSDQPLVALRIDIQGRSKEQEERYPEWKKSPLFITLWSVTAKDSKERDIPVEYPLGYKIPNDPETGKPIKPTTVRDTGKLIAEAPLAFDFYNMSKSTLDAYRSIDETLMPSLEELAQKDSDFKANPLHKSNAPVPSKIEQLLQDMNFVSQYSAIRQLHALEQTEGQSPQIMAALARGYANLSVLTSHYWHPVHNAFAGRAIWYAERLPQEGDIEIAKSDKSSEQVEKVSGSLWRDLHRAYVYGLLGYHSEALKQIAAVNEAIAKIDESKRPALPSWLSLIDGYCHFDVRRLRSDEISKSDKELAALIYFLALLEGNYYPATEKCGDVLSLKMVEAIPDCYRFYGTVDTGGLTSGNQRARLAGLMLANNLYHQTLLIPSVPESISQIAKSRENEDSDEQDLAEYETRQKLYRTLLGTLPASEEKGSPSPERDFLANDPNPLSWSTLGQLIKEISFLQARYQVELYARVYGSPADDAIEETLPLYEDHLLSDYIRQYTSDFTAKQKYVKRMLSRWPTNSVSRASKNFDHVPRLYREIEAHMLLYYYLIRSWSRTEDRHAAQATTHACLNMCARGFAIGHSGASNVCRTGRSYLKNSPHSPLVRSYLVKKEWKNVKAKEDLEQWEKEGYGFPSLLGQLGKQYWKDGQLEDALRCFENANAEIPEYKLFSDLADLYYKQEDFKSWQNILERLRESPGPGLHYSNISAKLADGLMKLRRWDDAVSFADDAAGSYSARGLLTAAKCHEALREWEKAEALYRASSMRYNNCAGDWLDYCLRTGRGDKEAAKEVMQREADSIREGLPQSARYCFVCLSYFYLHEPEMFLKLSRELEPCQWGYLLEATIFDDKGDTQKRDQALEFATNKKKDISRKALRKYPQLFKLPKILQKDLANGGKAEFDKEELDHLLAFCTDPERANMYFFLGHYCNARGKTEQAAYYLKRSLASVEVNHIRCTDAGALLHKLGFSLDDMDTITQELIKDEARWKEVREESKAKK